MKKAFFFSLCSIVLFSCADQKPEAEKTETTVASTEVAATPQPAEFADSKYAEIGKSGIANLSSGNVDAWMSTFAENAVWQFNNGDSLVGRAAITDYWKKRRTETIDSIHSAMKYFCP